MVFTFAKLFWYLGTTSFSLHSDKNEIEDDDDFFVEISVDHQLVLACCWLNLKECALTAAVLARTHISGGKISWPI